MIKKKRRKEKKGIASSAALIKGIDTAFIHMKYTQTLHLPNVRELRKVHAAQVYGIFNKQYHQDLLGIPKLSNTTSIVTCSLIKLSLSNAFQ